ncbi:uncharacterized protein TNCV_3524991 [Trichonephila clavipes]|uniref:Helitron helicase-like domain-containing protein n=1 Tax=Trichonephila clavipes TaxID=2585209 RepID=A0A8X6S8A8_TRICX|nr:uncharacterized protein TNCV_3524991 [Trichonephila clavipes]
MDKTSSHTFKSTTAYLTQKESETRIKCIPFNEICVKSTYTSAKDLFVFGLLKRVLGKRPPRTLKASYTICDFSTFYKFKSITSFLYNYASKATSNWPIYTSSTKEKSITSLRIRRATSIKAGKSSVHATETRSSESSDQREVRLETDRIRTNQIRCSERTELLERRLQNVRISTARSRRTLHADLNLSAFHYDSNNDYSLHQNVVIGKMDKICMYCSALKFKNETRGMCCASGKVKLPELHSPPEPLSTFLSAVTRVSKHFLENIRKYNSCFQMTSFGATNIVRENYMPTFRVQGQIYHHAGSLLPLPDADHKFLQIYFMANSDEQIEQRCHYNTGTRREIVGALQGLFDQHNELIRLV